MKKIIVTLCVILAVIAAFLFGGFALRKTVNERIESYALQQGAGSATVSITDQLFLVSFMSNRIGHATMTLEDVPYTTDDERILTFKRVEAQGSDITGIRDLERIHLGHVVGTALVEWDELSKAMEMQVSYVGDNRMEMSWSNDMVGLITLTTGLEIKDDMLTFVDTDLEIAGFSVDQEYLNAILPEETRGFDLPQSAIEVTGITMDEQGVTIGFHIHDTDLAELG